MLSIFLWKLDHNLLLFHIFKLSNDEITGTLTKYTNYTKQRGVTSCVDSIHIMWLFTQLLDALQSTLLPLPSINALHTAILRPAICRL